MDVPLFVTNNVNKTVTYFKDEVEVIILQHTLLDATFTELQILP